MVRRRSTLVAWLAMAAASLPSAIPASAAIDPGDYTRGVRDITVPGSSPESAWVWLGLEGVDRPMIMNRK